MPVTDCDCPSWNSGRGRIPVESNVARLVLKLHVRTPGSAVRHSAGAGAQTTCKDPWICSQTLCWGWRLNYMYGPLDLQSDTLLGLGLKLHVWTPGSTVRHSAGIGAQTTCTDPWICNQTLCWLHALANCKGNVKMLPLKFWDFIPTWDVKPCSELLASGPFLRLSGSSASKAQGRPLVSPSPSGQRSNEIMSFPDSLN